MAIGVQIGIQLGEGGQPSAGIVLSGSHSQDEGTAIGTLIGTLSVAGPHLGTYTFTKTADPDSAFTLAGDDIKNALEFDYHDATSHSFSVQGDSDNMSDPVLTRTFVIAVVDVAPVITSDNTASASVGDVAPFYTITATAYGDPPLTFDIIGADAADFTCDPDTGEVALADPDNVTPGDKDITVRAYDGTLYGTLPVTVTVAAISDSFLLLANAADFLLLANGTDRLILAGNV